MNNILKLLSEKELKNRKEFMIKEINRIDEELKIRTCEAKDIEKKDIIIASHIINDNKCKKIKKIKIHLK